MALKNPLMPSPTFQSAFSPYTDSPSSPAPFAAVLPMSNRSSSDKDLLHPPQSPYPAQVDPSPVDSQASESTDTTDIEQEAGEGITEEVLSPAIEVSSPQSAGGQTQDPLALNTSIIRTRSDSEDGPQSVIHAPTGYKSFEANKKSPPSRQSAFPHSDLEVPLSPPTPEPSVPQEEKRNSGGTYTSPINTTVPPVKDRPTPRATTRQEAEEGYTRAARPSSSLEDIAEADDATNELADQPSDLAPGQAVEDQADDVQHQVESLEEQNIMALKTALNECWTLCNTLSGLSSVHRKRVFDFSGIGEAQEHAWRTCWKLCQKLYEDREKEPSSQVTSTLELFKEFCQALFEARQRGDEIADSVLRVSFELNNHLYNTHDRNLPDTFRERTLDFYSTLCHRLMKQRTDRQGEADALLRACWELASQLMWIRGRKRDNLPLDEDLVGSAVQACWDLCDIFREGWTQVRPDRGTPKPTQTSFAHSFTSSASGSTVGTVGTRGQRSPPSHPPSRSSSSLSSSHRTPRLGVPPETPTTIFDDTTSTSPDEPSVPNILILGPDSSGKRTRWSSSVSELSDYSQGSQRTSSTARENEGHERNLASLRALIIRAAMNAGYQRNFTISLPVFVKALPSNSFGSLPWQMKLLEQYKRLVAAEPSLNAYGDQLPSSRFTASDVSRAVLWMGRSDQFLWLKDLFRLVCGFFPEDASGRKSVFVQT